MHLRWAGPGCPSRETVEEMDGFAGRRVAGPRRCPRCLTLRCADRRGSVGAGDVGKISVGGRGGEGKAPTDWDRHR